MILVTRLFNIHTIRHSSSTREFFVNLKKYYRSTTLNLFMASNNQTCFIFDKDDSTKILIQMVYEIPLTRIRRQFNLLRSMDESVSQTIRRLTANIERAVIKENKSNKRRQQNQTNEVLNDIKQLVVVKLLDSDNKIIDENQLNKEAWIHCRKLLINEQSYNIEYNAPGFSFIHILFIVIRYKVHYFYLFYLAVMKFRFPDIILTNTITTAFAEIDYGNLEHSLFDWYVANDIKPKEKDDIDDTTEWIHVHRGLCCVFSDEHINKFVRLACLPRNNELREGMQAEHTSKTRIIPCPNDLPMHTRHQLSKEYFPINSNL